MHGLHGRDRTRKDELLPLAWECRSRHRQIHDPTGLWRMWEGVAIAILREAEVEPCKSTSDRTAMCQASSRSVADFHLPDHLHLSWLGFRSMTFGVTMVVTRSLVDGITRRAKELLSEGIWSSGLSTTESDDCECRKHIMTHSPHVTSK